MFLVNIPVYQQSCKRMIKLHTIKKNHYSVNYWRCNERTMLQHSCLKGQGHSKNWKTLFQFLHFIFCTGMKLRFLLIIIFKVENTEWHCCNKLPYLKLKCFVHYCETQSMKNTKDHIGLIAKKQVVQTSQITSRNKGRLKILLKTVFMWIFRKCLIGAHMKNWFPNLECEE